MKSQKPKEVEKLEVTVLVDNYSDLLLENEKNVKRPPLSNPTAPIAEHGFSCLVKVFGESEEHIVLFDTGISPESVKYNANALGIDLSKIEAIVLSHGHADHFGGLEEVLKFVPKGIPVIMHPDALQKRRVNFPNSDQIIDVPTLDEKMIIDAGATIVKEKNASLICNESILVLGQIKRRSEFEKSLPWTEIFVNNKWEVDQFNDDQGLTVLVKDKGLVIISGCAHAGIINTILHAEEVSGVNNVEGVLGGFHLSGKMFEPIIEPTISELKKINPKVLIPMHCTGWKATTKIEAELPNQFKLNSVGTTYTFSSN